MKKIKWDWFALGMIFGFFFLFFLYSKFLFNFEIGATAKSGWGECNAGDQTYNRGACCELIGYPTYEECLANLSNPTCCGCFVDRCVSSTATPSVVIPTPKSTPVFSSPSSPNEAPGCTGAPVKYAPTILGIRRSSPTSVALEWTTTDSSTFVIYYGPMGSDLPWNVKIVGNETEIFNLPSNEPIDVKVCGIGICGDEKCSVVVDP